METISQRTDPDDARIRAALNDVPLPSGLEQRILSRLHLSVVDRSADQARSVVDRSADQAQIGLEQALLSNLPQPDTTEQPTALPTVQLPTAAPPSSGIFGRGSRRNWVRLSLALSVVAVAAGVWHWSRPTTPQRLAHYSLQLLDALQSPAAQWQTEQVPWKQLGALNGQLRNSIRPIGFLDMPGGPVASECRVWHLQSTITQKSFYVLDFHDARSVLSLSSQLEAIDRVSGGWTLYAQRSGDRVLVVLFEGAVSDYLVRPQSA